METSDLTMISQTAEYALRAVVFLAQQNGSLCTRAQISDSGLIPLDYLTRVMQLLCDAGIVNVRRGPGGGYMIAREIRDLTVLEVVSAVETLPRVTKCPLGLSEHELLCPLHAKLDEAAARFETALRDTLVIDLISSKRRSKKADQNHCSFPR